MTEQDQFAAHIREIHLKFSRIYAGILTDENLSLPQYALLKQLATYGDLTMTEASERLHLSKPAVTYLVDRLEKMGYLKRQSSSKDRRIYALHILAKGAKVAARVESHALDVMLSTLNQFDDKQKEIIDQFYVSLSSTLDQKLATPGQKSEK